MKSAITLVSIGFILTQSYASQVFETYPTNQQKKISDDGSIRKFADKNMFGSAMLVEESEDFIKKEIYSQSVPLYGSWSRRHEYLTQQTERIKKLRQKQSDGTLHMCQQRGDNGTEPYEFLPEYAGSVNQTETSFTYTGGLCFQSVQFSVSYNPSPEDFQNVTLTIKPSQSKSLLCSDYFFIGSLDQYHIEDFYFSRTSEITFANLNDDQKADLKFNGIRIYLFCDGIIDEAVSLFQTLELFAGGISPDPNLPIFGSHIPEYMEKANVDFLNESIGWELEVRPIEFVDLDPQFIKTGDFFMVYRLDGLDPMIMYGTGSHIGHCVMAMWMDDGELYMVESQDGWYWPVHNIQKNKYKDWVQYSRNADFQVAILPLSEAMRAKWNHTSAMEFWNKTEGLPYGYHTFLWGWVDTPDSNMPPLIPSKFIPILFELLNNFIPTDIDIMFSQGLNKRLGTQNLTLSQVAAEAARRNLSVQDVMALPEIDGWLYSGISPRDGLSYVCSSYVVAMYKHAGLFDDLTVNPQELHDRDLYNLNLFNLTQERPQMCIDADPDLPYCQITGKYRVRIEPRELSYIEPFSDMFEKCPTQPPNDPYPAGC